MPLNFDEFYHFYKEQHEQGNSEPTTAQKIQLKRLELLEEKQQQQREQFAAQTKQKHTADGLALLLGFGCLLINLIIFIIVLKI